MAKSKHAVDARAIQGPRRKNAPPQACAQQFGWQDWSTIVGLLLSMGGMSDVPLSLRATCFFASAICLTICFFGRPGWPSRARWGCSVSVCLVLAIAFAAAYRKSTEVPPEQKKLDSLTALLISQDEQRTLLQRFPLGFTTFSTNQVTGAVTPIQARAGLDSVSFDYSKVRVTQSPNALSVQLPDIFRDGKPLQRNVKVTGLRDLLLTHAFVQSFGTPGDMTDCSAQILSFKGDEIIWVYGLSHEPS